MKKRKTVIVIVLIAVILLDAAVIGLTVKEYLDTNTVAQSTVTRAVLILIGTALTLTKLFVRNTPKRTAAFYRKQYSDLMGTAYVADAKGEKLLARALDAFNKDQPMKAIKLLGRLWQSADAVTDRFAVAAFTGLCYDDLKYYPQAIEWYERASALSVNSTVLSNAGICYQRTGNHARAIDAYERAIKADPQNATAYSNVANLYIREAEYEGALEYAEKALALNANLHAAHSARAVAYAGLGRDEDYEKALRQAAAAGADRRKIESAVRYLLDEND